MDNLDKLMNHTKKYKKTEKWFDIAKEKLCEWTNQWDSENETPPKYDKKTLSITFSYAGTLTECRFSYNDGVTILTFGYIKTDKKGKPSFELVSHRYVDHLGNISDERDGHSFKSFTSLDSEMGDIVFYFLNLIYGAMETAWREQSAYLESKAV